MPKKAKGLTARQVETMKTPGDHADGNGLYMRVKPSGMKTWLFRYQVNGHRHAMGLGSTRLKSLAQAREKSYELALKISDGIDPIQERKVLERKTSITFMDAAARYIKVMSPSWKNVKHAQQWQNTLRDYVFPSIGRLHPSNVTLAHIKAILTPIWTTKTETANRVRQRIEAVLDWAFVHELRSSDNPARWRGVLDKIYPAPNQISRVRHHPSCPYNEAPGVLAQLRQSSNLSSRCLRLVILTATRSGEARGARWEEFDLEKETWLIPGERTKAKREHLIPLSKEALELVKSLPLIDNQSFLFPNSRGGCLSDVGLSKALHVIMDDVTVHGFRSSFRQWAAEQTSFPESVCELALAHVNSNRTEAAYQRSDLFERRRELMEAWCGYLSARSEVVSIHKLRVP